MSSADHRAIERVYGPNPDLYQILNVSKTASSTQIREAYFCLRYDIYQQLSNEAGSTLSDKERAEIEAKMDAITGAFRVLTDPGKRIHYDSSMMDNESNGDGEYLDGRDKAGHGEHDEKRAVNSRIHRSVFRRRGNAGSTKNSKSDEGIPTVRSGAGGGMQYVRSRAETVTGFRKKNLDRSQSRDNDDEEASTDSEAEERAKTKETATNKYAKPAVKSSIVAQRKQRQSRNRSSASKETAEEEPTAASNHDDVSSSLNTSTTSTVGVYQEHLPVGVDNLNIREQMLYKNQMYLHTAHNNTSANARGNTSQSRINVTGSRSRIASRYQAEERRDWLVSQEDETITDDDPEEGTARDDDDDDDERESRVNNKKRSSHRKNKVTSPTGVDDFESARPYDNVKTKKKAEALRTKSKSTSNKPNRFSFDDDVTKSTYQGDDDTTHTQDDDDTRTYDDTSTNYDDDTTNFDDTTMGDTLDETTIGESVLSYDDDTYASDMKKYSPGHKKGNRPEPILRGGEKYSSRSGKEVDNRRVTIHSHRGRKGRSDDKDFAESMCPFPSMKDIKEEVRGTCKDASSAFHQVLHAFVISPDDIDRMSDKIRDAKVELTENYQRQLKERKKAGNGKVGRELRI